MSCLDKARKLAGNGYTRKWLLKGVLCDIHGAYSKRVMHKEVKRKSGRKREQKREEEEGAQAAVLSTKSDTDINRTMTDEIEVHAFPHDEKGLPMVPLGGTRGYIAGALKAAARSYGTQRGQKFFGILSHIDKGGIVIKPAWVTLKNKEEKTPMEYPTTMAGGGGKIAQVIYFDIVKESPIEIEINECATYQLTKTKGGTKAKDQTKEQPFTTVLMDEDDFLMLLGKLEDSPIGPKGRGRIKWISIEKID